MTTLALPIERTIGDRTGEADTLGRIASDYDDLDEKKKAIEYYELALPIERPMGTAPVKPTRWAESRAI